MVHILLAVIYLAFISLGLPDSLLGASWPMMYQPMGVSVSYAGIVSVIISCGTVLSSLMTDRVTRKFGTGMVTAASVFMTALALLGFSFSNRFWMLCVFAIPYGLGAGSVDASLNHYVAVNYASRHMSWLHCMWGVGASIGPYIMSLCLLMGASWPSGYQVIGTFQLILTLVLFLSLPLWRKSGTTESISQSAPMPLWQVLKIPGAKALIIAFFCYCGVESLAFLWTSSYFVLHYGLKDNSAAACAGLFYLGMTVGRAVNGFLTFRLSDRFLIRAGSAIIVLGVVLLLVSPGHALALIALVIVGLGCAPIYPCIIHSTPETFGIENSQAMIGVQMASAYLGNLLIPPIFGFVANHFSIALYPAGLLLLSVCMILSYQRMVVAQQV